MLLPWCCNNFHRKSLLPGVTYTLQNYVITTRYGRIVCLASPFHRYTSSRLCTNCVYESYPQCNVHNLVQLFIYGLTLTRIVCIPCSVYTTFNFLYVYRVHIMDNLPRKGVITVLTFQFIKTRILIYVNPFVAVINKTS
jgi:hypothetical protein